jgi:apolipoprotein N-acyltransferase
VDLLPAILSSILAGLAFQFPQLALLMWFALIPFFYGLFSKKRTKTQAWLYCFSFALIYYLYFFSALWSMYPLNWLNLSGIASFIFIGLGILLLSCWQAIWLAWLGPLNILGKQSFILNSVLIACTWVLIEACQSWLTFGFTGSQIGLSQYPLPILIQGSSLFGAQFISFLIVFFNSLLTEALVHGHLVQILTRKAFDAQVPKHYYLSLKQPEPQGYILQEINHGTHLSQSLLALALAILIFLSNCFTGYFRLFLTEPNPKATVRIALVQIGLPSNQVWNQSYLDQVMQRYQALSSEAAQTRPQLIFWPETAIPSRWDPGNTLDNTLQGIAEASNAYLLSGAFHKEYNSMILLSPQNEAPQLYHKQLLVPFGEYLPFNEFLRPLLLRFLPGRTNWPAISASEEALGPMQTPWGPIGNLICCEAIVPKLARLQVLAGAQSLMISSNDAWFTGSSLQTKLLGQAVFRSIENHRMAARVTSNGITAVIDPKGRISHRLVEGERAFLLTDLKLYDQQTIYNRFHSILLILCSGFLIVFFLKQLLN